MSDTSAPIELEGFERIDAARGTVLLRVKMRCADPAALTETGTLVIDEGARQHRFEPLPAPPDPPGTLRLAFPTPAALLGAETRYALAFPDGTTAELPSPQAPGAGSTRESTAAASLAAAAEESEARALALEQVVRSESERRERLAQEVQALTEQLDAEARAADAVRAASLLEVEQARKAADTAHADAERAREKLSSSREALWKAQEEIRAVHAELEQAQRHSPGQDDEPRVQSRAARERLRQQRELAQRRAATHETVRRAREDNQIERRPPRTAPPSEEGEDKKGAAEPPPLLEARAERPGGPPWRISAAVPALVAPWQLAPPSLRSETAVGMLLLVLGLVLAVLILTGGVKLGFG